MSKYFLLLFISICCLCSGQANYPVPLGSDKLLFYLQRPHNKNTIIYELNTLADGNIDLENVSVGFDIKKAEQS